MSDKEENELNDPGSTITPFRLPESAGSHETFSARMKRRRQEVGTISAASSSSSNTEEARGWRRSSRHLLMMILESPHASATIARKDGKAAQAVEGIEAVLFAGDIGGVDALLGRAFPDEPLLANRDVAYKGQPVALIIGEGESVCRKARDLIEIEYHTAPGILTVEHAVAMKSFHGEARTTERGNVKTALASSPNQYHGSLTIKPQQPCFSVVPELAISPQNHGKTIEVKTAALLPTEIRSAVAQAAGISESAVELKSLPLPGITSALELEPIRLAILATHAALRCKASIRVVLDSLQSPVIAGQRHFVQGEFDVGFEDNGTILAADVRLDIDGGYFIGDSASVLDRALLHSDSIYGIPNFRTRGLLCKTNNITSSTMPAEGAAQGAWFMEEIIQIVACQTGTPVHEVREKNFYREAPGIKTTPYGQPVNCTAIQRIWKHALGRSEYHERVREIDKWNHENFSYKRGIAITPIKFGLGDSRPDRNMGMTHLQIFPDGSIQVRPGLVDLNDGLDLQIKEEVSHHLGVPQASIRVVLGDFEALAQATPVLNVDSAGLILRALDDACKHLIDRLRDVALQLFAARGQTEVEAETIRFFDGKVGFESSPIPHLNFQEVVNSAWKKRVNLLAVGFHRTPNLWWDPELGAGWPFSSFTYAAAVTEIQVDAFTGEIQILRTDITHEGSPTPDQGDRDEAQLFRSFNLGTGWILSETTPDPAAADKEFFSFGEGIPGFADAPFQWKSDRLRPMGDLLSAAGDPCGQAPVLLAYSIREALWDALRAFGFEADLDINLPLPATPQKVLAVCREISRQLAAKEKENAAVKSSGSHPPEMTG